MMITKAIGTFMILAGLLVGQAARAEDGRGNAVPREAPAKVTLQATCPVMGGKINPELYVDQDGRRIYVCCQGCIAPVRKEFAKFAKKIEANGEVVAKLQASCPVMGGKIDRKLYVDYGGMRVYVCCQGCIEAVRTDPTKHIEKLAEKGEVPAAAPKAATDR